MTTIGSIIPEKFVPYIFTVDSTQYCPMETEIAIVQDSKVTQIIQVPKMHLNQLFAIHGVLVFKHIEEYMGLLADERLRFNIYEVSMDFHSVSVSIAETHLFFDALFSVSGEIFGIQQNLVYHYTRTDFKLLGQLRNHLATFDIVFEKPVYKWTELFTVLLVKEKQAACIFHLDLVPPKICFFDYEIGETHYIYAPTRQLIVARKNEIAEIHPLDFELDGIDQKRVQVGDKVYSFMGDIWGNRRFAVLFGADVKFLDVFPQFIYEFTNLFVFDNRVFVAQPVSSIDDGSFVYEYEEGSFVFRGFDSRCYELVDNVKDIIKSIPENTVKHQLAQGNGWTFYKYQAVQMKDDKIIDSFWLPQAPNVNIQEAKIVQMTRCIVEKWEIPIKSGCLLV